jgi:hypothetical protein
MLQKANDQKDNDHQDAKYIIAKFELITPFELPFVKGHAGRGTRWFRVTNSLY